MVYLLAAKKLKKEKLGTFSSPGRVKSGRGPGRPPKHPRVEDTTPNPPPSDLLALKVRKSLIIYILNGSLVPRPSRPPTNIMRNYFYSAQKVGRSGRFCDAMIMSGGRGLAQHDRGWKNVWNVGKRPLNGV